MSPDLWMGTLVRAPVELWRSCLQSGRACPARLACLGSDPELGCEVLQKKPAPGPACRACLHCHPQKLVRHSCVQKTHWLHPVRPYAVMGQGSSLGSHTVVF